MTATIDEPQVGLCWECGYSLQGLPTPRCPECGRPFDPADPATMNLGQHVGPVARRLMRPPGWPLYSLTAFAVLLSLWAAAAPMPSGQIVSLLSTLSRLAEQETWGDAFTQYYEVPVRYAYAILAWGLVAGIWVARRGARGITVRRIARGQRAATFAYWRRWLIPHFVLIATILFCLTPAPVYLGFWASKSSIEHATPTRPNTRAYFGFRRAEARWLGVYPVSDGRGYVRAADGRLVVEVSHLGGFVYSPQGWPSDWGSAYDIHELGGGWYIYQRGDVYR